MHTAVCLASGGQDSTTCMYWAMHRFERIMAVSFDYGQRHQIELEAARLICQQAGVQLEIVSLTCLQQLGGSALMDTTTPIHSASERNALPNTFVPGRNLLFLTVAAAYAYKRDIHDLVIGTCQTDYSGYPDCRESTMQSMARSLSLGLDTEVHIHTPLMHLSKAESVHLAQQVGAMAALAFSHTCYEGMYPPCGNCPACILRAKGFSDAGVTDPLLQRAAQGCA